ncbi:molecular chaperone TorD family protein [Nocardioides nanhaiensis]|uniref:Uncharacterized protein n=1 Tax=Nocardioides nanhaiensis TaxID=1476871 RepID=A0ABP8WGN8_9ACTN
MSTTETQNVHPSTGRTSQHWELLRALGAAVLTPAPGNREVCHALDLAAPSGAEHTGVFVLAAPPHAAIHLGPEGQLGGEGLDRVAGFWRALGLRAPEDADHLGTLLMLYAELGTAESTTPDERLSAQLQRSRTALLHEHLWSWAPGYLAAVESLGVPATTAWADLTLQALQAEVVDNPTPALLPLALRSAPPGLQADDSLEDTLDVLVTPIRSGYVLTQRDLQVGATRADVGFRRGERRYALKAMLQQDPRATLAWLGEHASAWSAIHARTGHDATSTWRDRADRTAQVLVSLLEEQPATRSRGEEQ